MGTIKICKDGAHQRSEYDIKKAALQRAALNLAQTATMP
jgi:hypothetical protein